MPVRNASAVWEGGLKGGKGTFKAESGTVGGTSATENLEGCSSTLTYNFTATQRTAASK